MSPPENRDSFWDRERETAPWPTRRADLELRFLAQFGHAASRSPAYADILTRAGVDPEAVKGLDDLSLLPVLHMSDLAERQRDDPPFGGFSTLEPHEIRRVYVNPGLLCQPGAGRYTDTSWAQALAAAGFGPGDVVANTFNYHLWPYAFMLDDSVGMLGGTVVPTGTGNTMMQVRIMHLLGVTGFMGTPSFLMTLAQRAEGMGLDPLKDLKLNKALVGAEMLPESLRRRIENKTGARVRQAYGTVFLGCLGFECAHASGLHVPDNVVLELIDPDSGRPVEPGQPGEVVASNLDPAMPFIRLGTGDLSILAEGDCPCGRSGPRLVKVLGRVEQAAKVQGTFVHPWQADEVVARYPEIFKYQVIIRREGLSDVMTFKVEPVDESVDQRTLAARLARDIKELLYVRGRVEVVPRGSIPDFHDKIVDERRWD